MNKTNKELINIIRKYKTVNCPAYSNKKKSELVKIVNNLNLIKAEPTVKKETKKPTKELTKKPTKEPTKKPTKEPTKKLTKKKSENNSLSKLNKKEQEFINKKEKIKKKIDIENKKLQKQFNIKSKEKIEKLDEELDDIIKKEKEYYRLKFDTFNF